METNLVSGILKYIYGFAISKEAHSMAPIEIGFGPTNLLEWLGGV